MKKIGVVLVSEAEEVYNYLNEEALNSRIDHTILKTINKKRSFNRLRSETTSQSWSNDLDSNHLFLSAILY